MASTLLELARSNHEELEVGTNRIVKLLGTETKTHKQKLIQQVLAFCSCLTSHPNLAPACGLFRGMRSVVLI